jgi:kynurenine formamidase
MVDCGQSLIFSRHMQLIDLSQTIAAGMSLFHALPLPQIKPWMSHAQSAFSGRYEGCTIEITAIDFVTSIGTYLDSPFHFNPNGVSIEHLSLEQLVLPGVVIDCTNIQAQQPIGPELLAGKNIQGKAVLFHTGWSRYWGQQIYHDFPFLTEATALALHEGGAKLAGIDCLAIDDINNPRRPVHVTLLHNNILIVENLTNLDALPADSFIFHAVPVKVAGAASFPVRAYAVASNK